MGGRGQALDTLTYSQARDSLMLHHLYLYQAAVSMGTPLTTPWIEANLRMPTRAQRRGNTYQAVLAETASEAAQVRAIVQQTQQQPWWMQANQTANQTAARQKEKLVYTIIVSPTCAHICILFGLQFGCTYQN